MSDLILVTGASGYVGKWCVVKLLEKGYRVRGTVRGEAKGAQVRATIEKVLGGEAAGRLELAFVDILDDAGWAEAMAGVDAVMHVAAAVRADEILTSSIATVGYGHGHTTGRRTYTEADFTNLDNMRWTWAYCIGKTRAEQAAWAFAKANGLELTTIHPGAIIGPALDDDASISIKMVTGLLDGETPALPSNGYAIIDVRDVADMHVAALENRETIGKRYLATAEYMPFPKVADILREAYPDRVITQRVVPDWLIKLIASFGGPARQIINDIGNEKIFDGSRGEALLGHPYIAARQSILETAESALELGMVK